MGRGHLKDGCRLGYYYLDGGSKAIDRWMPSGWKADVPRAGKIHQHILTLATQERVHSRQKLYQRGDECAERCQSGTWRSRQSSSSGPILRVHLVKLTVESFFGKEPTRAKLESITFGRANQICHLKQDGRAGGSPTV